MWDGNVNAVPNAPIPTLPVWDQALVFAALAALGGVLANRRRGG